jgi:STAS-like domain of unknown function (DUF4325)
MVESQIKYRIFDLSGDEFAPEFEDAEILHEKVEQALNDGQTVELDFTGIQRVHWMFFDIILGDLYDKYTPEELDRRLKFTNLYEEAQEDLEDTKRDEIQYASYDAATRQKLAESLEKMFWPEG